MGEILSPFILSIILFFLFFLLSVIICFLVIVIIAIKSYFPLYNAYVKLIVAEKPLEGSINKDMYECMYVCQQPWSRSQ